MSESEANRRSLFRLRFPLGEQPVFVTELGDYTVIELAEKSARLADNGIPLCSEKWTSGIVKLKTGLEIPTTVKLSRIDDDQLVVLLGQHITLKVIIAEQSRLLAKYGKPKPQNE